MFGRFLVMVENMKGEFITAFAFDGRLDEAIQRGRERAYQRNVWSANITAQLVANQ